MSVGCYDKVKKHLAHTESVVNLRLELALEVINNLFSCFVSTKILVYMKVTYLTSFLCFRNDFEQVLCTSHCIGVWYIGPIFG